MTTPRHRNYQRRNPNRLVTDAPKAHPLARIVFSEMRRQMVVYDDIAEKSGVTRASMKSWRLRSIPSTASIEAVLGYLGWRLTATPAPDRIPPDLFEELAALAQKCERSMPETWALLVEISAKQQALPLCQDECSLPGPEREAA
jgi:hypothetical protein